MKNNEYKKYYDKVSPDQKLVDETKIKMLEELAKTQRENITFWTASRRYIAAAACFVLIGATIAIVPNLQKIPVAENNINKNAVTTTVTSIKPDDEALPVTSVTTQKEDKIVSEKYTTFFRSVIAFGRVHIRNSCLRILFGLISERMSSVMRWIRMQNVTDVMEKSNNVVYLQF